MNIIINDNRDIRAYNAAAVWVYCINPLTLTDRKHLYCFQQELIIGTLRRFVTIIQYLCIRTNIIRIYGDMN